MPTHSISNQPLAKSLRTQLENTVKSARDVAEKGARAALAQLAVGEAKAPDYLSEDLKALRRRLRAHGRALGDAKAGDDTQGLQHLMWEVAYEHWHRMLFARFLAENGLLLWEPGAAVSLDDCEALVQEADPAMNLGAKTKWELAGKLAARMLPQVFKPQSPVFELAFAPEHQRELERLLAALPAEVFKASDSLGWVYQFWQAKRKDEVNASEVKIGADELPAVTQLFTEPYMVDFLLHNSLGAWWATRHPGQACPVPLTYLRTLDDGTPAAGKFEGWPDRLDEFKLLDPCCGSGHFLVAAFLLLVPMRMAAEGVSAMDAVDAVLADNLHGLEIDARCVEIAVFALALAAWRFPDENGDPLGVRTDMPAPQIACCGLKVTAKPQDWMALVPDDAPNAQLLRQELRLLHASFAQAPLLGSLLDPARSLKNDLATSSFETLRDLLGRALATEQPSTLWGQASELQDDSWDLALTAKGLLDAARLLDGRYHLVVTNVPYLGREGHEVELVNYAERAAPDAAADLATLMLDRCLALLSEAGVISVVMPQNWWVGKSYEDFRKRILRATTWQFAVVLGEEAWQSFGNRGPNTVLLTLRGNAPHENHCFTGLDVGSRPGEAIFTQEKKVEVLASATQSSTDSSARALRRVHQTGLAMHAGSKVSFAESSTLPPLARWVVSGEGSSTGDGARFAMYLWELQDFDGWLPYLEPGPRESMFADAKQLLRWEHGGGELSKSPQARIQNTELWSKQGVLVGRVRGISAGISIGGAFTKGAVMVCPRHDEDLPAILTFLRSAEYERLVRERDPRVSASTSVLTEIPFDAGKWASEAGRLLPAGLPGMTTQDAAQLAFHGHPRPAIDPLQVAVARLAGYRWPAETDVSMRLAGEAREWTNQCEKLAAHADNDGIVCLPSVRGESPAHDRLLKLLIAAWETVQPGSWKPAVLDKLLADAECAGKGLDVWLREKFFEQHAKRFQHRPFIWHVWDGLKDGFAALVNYHRLDAKNLERLIHTYLGDWIRQQEAGVRDRIDGAPTRLAAAQDLKRRLELILEGEPPYDIFVRWKPLAEQPIGWNPDLNDGVRLNIRPFMTAEALRHNKKPKLNITWDKDKGKDAESAPWFKVFNGERTNNYHLSSYDKFNASGELQHQPPQKQQHLSASPKLGSKLSLEDIVEVNFTVEVPFGDNEISARRRIVSMAARAAGCRTSEIEIVGIARENSIFAKLKMKVLYAFSLKEAISSDSNTLPDEYRDAKVSCDIGLDDVRGAVPISSDKPLVVFVHGLGGSEETFGNFPLFLNQEHGLQCLSFNYTSGFFHADDLYSVAKYLGNEIILSGCSKIAFIGHSLGGIVVRRLLAEMCALGTFRESISARTCLVALFASPMTGSALASLLSYVPFGLNNTQIASLQKSSGNLVHLNDVWSIWSNKHSACDIMKFYGNSDKVVPPTDAAIGPGQGFPVPLKDHSTIVKPADSKEYVVRETAAHIKAKFA